MAYLFTSQRLGFRNWVDEDLEVMTLLNNDPEVMKYFPGLQDKKTTLGFITRMQDEFAAFKYCYFAVDLLESNEFIGFIGISNQDYGKELGKFTDIGWRLKRSVWGRGIATEGAKRCIEHAKTELLFNEIYAVAPTSNTLSINVMEKIGMKFQENFDHPKLIDHPTLKQCGLYRINL